MSMRLGFFLLFTAIAFLRPRLTPYLIILAVPFMPKIRGGLASTTSLEEVVILASIAGMFCYAIFGQHVSIRKDGVFVAYLTFIFILTFTGLLHWFDSSSSQMRVDIIQYIKLLLPFLTLIVTRWAIQERSQVNRLMHLFLGVSVILAVMGLLQHYMLFNVHVLCNRFYPLWGDPSYGARFTYFREATATFDGLHVYSGIYFMICTVIAAHFYFFGSRRKLLQSFYLICTGLNLVALTMTFSRAATICVNVGLAVILLQVILSVGKDNRYREIALIAVLITSIAFIFFPYVDKHRLVERFEADSASVLVMENRGFCWKEAFRVSMYNPIVGYGFRSMSASIQFREPHNAYLQIVLVGGLILFIPFLLLIYKIGKKLWDARHEVLIGWGLPVFLSMLAFEMSSFNLFTWDRGRVNSMIWVLFGLALSLPFQGERDAVRVQSRATVSVGMVDEAAFPAPEPVLASMGYID
ncbi:MAG: O-antigen ligase family protein [bacterium]